jgi:hypothetical protein
VRRHPPQSRTTVIKRRDGPKIRPRSGGVKHQCLNQCFKHRLLSTHPAPISRGRAAMLSRQAPLCAVRHYPWPTTTRATSGSDSQHVGYTASWRQPQRRAACERTRSQGRDDVSVSMSTLTRSRSPSHTRGPVASVIPNRPESIRKLMKKLGPGQQLRVLRGGPDRLCDLLAADGPRGAL